VPAKQHVVRLTADDRTYLGRFLRQTGASAHEQRRARILLHADASTVGPRLTDREIAAAAEVTPRTVARVRSQFVRQGLIATVHRKTRPDRRVRKLEGTGEAQLMALMAADPPAGQSRWSLRLLADQLVLLEIVASISPETVRQALKKTPSSPG
jgi:hypothetical protein